MKVTTLFTIPIINCSNLRDSLSVSCLLRYSCLVTEIYITSFLSVMPTEKPSLKTQCLHSDARVTQTAWHPSHLSHTLHHHLMRARHLSSLQLLWPKHKKLRPNQGLLDQYLKSPNHLWYFQFKFK